MQFCAQIFQFSGQKWYFWIFWLRITMLLKWFEDLENYFAKSNDFALLLSSFEMRTHLTANKNDFFLKKIFEIMGKFPMMDKCCAKSMPIILFISVFTKWRKLMLHAHNEWSSHVRLSASLHTL